MDPTRFLQEGPVRIPETRYAVCRTDQDHPAAFATVRDEAETTVVVEEDDVDAVDPESVETGWRRLTFEVELPFELVGFLATVATALAEADVSVFVVSSYSTDHVFVTEDDLDAAIERLDALGCTVADRPESRES